MAQHTINDTECVCDGCTVLRIARALDKAFSEHGTPNSFSPGEIVCGNAMRVGKLANKYIDTIRAMCTFEHHDALEYTFRRFRVSA